MVVWNDSQVEWHEPKAVWYGGIILTIRVILLIIVTILGLFAWGFTRILEMLGLQGGDIAVQKIWARTVLRILGFSIDKRGSVAKGGAAIVANHISWVDILAFAAYGGGYFVAKIELSQSWGVGFIARRYRTVFIVRERSETARFVEILRERFQKGDRILFYPEATTSDGLQVLPFKRSLFEALNYEGQQVPIQPLSFFFEPPKGASANYYGLWGDMSLGVHVVSILKQPRQGCIHMKFGEILPQYDTRRETAKAAEAAIKAQHQKFMLEWQQDILEAPKAD